MARLHSAKKSAVGSSKSKQNKKTTSNRNHKNKSSPPDSGKGARENVKAKDGESKARPNEDLDSFKKDVLALGGDEEDYKRLKDVNSDVDVLAPSDGDLKRDASLSKDLAKFMGGLNFASVKPQELEDESEEEEDEESSEEDGDGEGSSEATSDEVEEKETGKAAEKKQNINIPKVGPNSRLLFDPTPQWYSALPPLPSSSKPPPPPSPQTVAARQSHAAALHAAELSAYESATSANKLTASSSDTAFLQRVLTSGTLSDRLSALTLMAQSSPVHNTRALETLRGMGQKKGREESLKALRAIADWWMGGGAPDRKLKYFIDQRLSHPGVSDKHLLVWHFEDWLKKYFYSLLQVLEALSLDPLPYVRLQAMSLIFTLLREKPEQEQNLLRLLVNKLGDSERSVASRASYHILQLLQVHPQMKAVVVREIASLALRPLRSSASTTQSGATHLKFSDDPKPSTKANSKPKSKSTPHEKGEKKDLQQEHAKYYAAITLNQVMLAPTEADRAVAVQLVGLYFELFKEILGSSAAPDTDAAVVGEEVDHSRMGKEKRKKQEQRNENSKGRGKGKGKEEHDNSFTEVEDSNSRLISAILTGVNRALPFAKLGIENVEFSKHIDTLFLICHKSTFNISLQALRLLLQICQSLLSAPSQSSSSASLSNSITDRYYRTLYASLHDIRLNASSKQAMYLNLLLKSMKMDTKKERVQAFVRRFVQLLVGAGNGAVEFVAGGLFLLGEIYKVEPSLRELLGKPSPRPSDGSTDSTYDPKKRDPQYAHAGASPMWELIPLLTHYHPTVRLHTSQLLAGKELTANADLSLNTLSHFLDRFVYKNPKKLKPRGASAMQPAAVALDGTSVRVVKGAQEDGSGMVNDEAFLRKDVKDVPVDQVFFHKFFSKKSEKEKAKAEKVAKRKGGAESDDENEDEDEDEEEGEGLSDDEAEVAKAVSGDEGEDESEGEAEIWNAIKATHPDLRGDHEDDVSDDDEISIGSGEDLSDEDAGNGIVDKDGDDDDDGSEDGLSLAEGSDADDLIDLDNVEMPAGLIEYDSGASVGEGEGTGAGADEEWGGFGADDAKKRKRGARKEDTRSKKRRLRALPTFATYEDYAKLIEDGPEDDI
ncbi:hypothetical protein M0805_006492 [Coniferiporia weirii]|nr:hypothetical protein M0805_006492 [Coniferiporia weirii]